MNKIRETHGPVILRTYLQVKVETDTLTSASEIKNAVQELFDKSWFPNAHVSVLRSNHADQNGSTIHDHVFQPERVPEKHGNVCVRCGKAAYLHYKQEEQLSHYTDNHNDAHQKALDWLDAHKLLGKPQTELFTSLLENYIKDVSD